MGKQQPYRPVTVPANAGAVPREAEVAAPPSAPTEEVAVKAPKPAGVKVKNLRDTWFVQPGTLTRIDAGEEKVLAYDGWLLDQIAARHLAEVK